MRRFRAGAGGRRARRRCDRAAAGARRGGIGLAQSSRSVRARSGRSSPRARGGRVTVVTSAPHGVGGARRPSDAARRRIRRPAAPRRCCAARRRSPSRREAGRRVDDAHVRQHRPRPAAHGRAFSLMGARRQLRAVQAERAAIKPQHFGDAGRPHIGRDGVPAALRARRRAALRHTVVGRHRRRERTSRRGRVPHVDARTRRFTAGRGNRGARRRRRSTRSRRRRGLAGVHAAAPVRRESPQGGPALERFTIAAVVRHDGASGAAAGRAATKVAR